MLDDDGKVYNSTVSAIDFPSETWRCVELIGSLVL